MSSFFRKEVDRKRLYDSSYYSSQDAADIRRSAEAVVRVVASLLEIGSVVDVGCGIGIWLSVFREHGAKQILGLDGDHVDPAWLRIPSDCFRAIDLSKPFRLNQQFDLALCLEVAEHLPRKCAADLVQSLVQLAPVILFSATIPFQGGTYHVNEQWPRYWQERFARHRYRMLDIIRKEIWKQGEIKYWYRQNIFLFVRDDLIPSRACFREAAAYPNDLLLLHPDILERQIGLRSLLKHLPGSVWRAAKHIKHRFLES